MFCSPYSISAAFAMLLNGARDATLAELYSALYLQYDLPTLNNAYRSSFDGLTGNKNIDGYEFQVANHFWAQTNLGFKNEFLNTLQTYYDSGVGEYDFRSDIGRQQAIVDINSWASNNTNDKIKNVVNDQSITEDTRFVITNAVYFLGEWLSPFVIPANGFPKVPFQTESGKNVDVDMMSQESWVPYYEDENLQAIELKYAAKNKVSEYSMVMMLPKSIDGLNTLVNQLSTTQLTSILANMQTGKVSINIPRFHIENEYQLGKTLSQEMGMPLTFSDAADFSGMTTQEALKVGEVIHKTFIDVDNKGTEAAAVTAIIGLEATSIDIDIPVSFFADHPFLFAIRHIPSNSMIFMGTLSQPE